MKTFIATLALASAAALGLAPKASAAPIAPASSSVLAHGSVHVGIGTGGYGYRGYGGYGYGRGVATGGYYVTQYRWVQQPVLVGYDRFRHPIYDMRWVQQPYQVWIPVTYVAPAYSPGVSVGFGYRWH